MGSIFSFKLLDFIKVFSYNEFNKGVSKMKPTELKNLIATRFKAGIKRPLHVESSPGVGKTRIAEQAAKELEIGFKVVHAPLMQPEDYGFPSISQDKTNVNFIVSKDKFPLEHSDCPETGIFLIDEISQADNSAQKILANLIQEREIHGQRLKQGWNIVSTGNRTTDRAGANRLLSHLKNRLTTVELEASVDDWTTWAFENGIKTEVVAFVRFRNDLLNAFDSQLEINPTPRSWAEGVSQSLGVVDPSLEFASFKGDVGEGAAAEFCAFLKVFRKIPSPDAIIMHPKSTPCPQIGDDKDASSILYALCGSLAAKASPDNFARIMQYVNRMPAEFSVLFVRDAIKRTPAIQNAQEFIKWASGDGAKILI
jgi:hypothetical protein